MIQFLTEISVVFLGGLMAFQLKRLDRKNTAQHNIAQSSRAEHQYEIEVALRKQDIAQAEQVAGLTGKLEVIHDDVRYTRSSLDSHLGDHQAHNF